jgi:hypothetical protein
MGNPGSSSGFAAQNEPAIPQRSATLHHTGRAGDKDCGGAGLGVGQAAKKVGGGGGAGGKTGPARLEGTVGGGDGRGGGGRGGCAGSAGGSTSAAPGAAAAASLAAAHNGSPATCQHGAKSRSSADGLTLHDSDAGEGIVDINLEERAGKFSLAAGAEGLAGDAAMDLATEATEAPAPALKTKRCGSALLCSAGGVAWRSP